MSGAVICTGCGQPVSIPPGYSRNKIQCSGCGVICPVSADARAAAAQAAPSRSAPASSGDDNLWDTIYAPSSPAAAPLPSDPLAEDELAPSQHQDAPAAKRPAPQGMLFPCRRCGQKVRRQGECPSCDGFRSETAAPDVAPPEPVLRLSLDDEPEDEEDNGQPYVMVGGPQKKCPKCSKEMAADAVVCLACGYHLEKRRKLTKTYQPIDRAWETNYSFSTRLTLFLIITAFTLVTGIVGLVIAVGMPPVGFAVTWLYVTGMIAFLLGTFDHIRVTRDTRGRAQIIKSWRVCFFRGKQTVLDVRGYGGITASTYSDVRFGEWFILLQLLASGILPALIWYYQVMHKPVCQVALTEDHGYVTFIVYRGRNENQMREIAHTLANATSMQLEGA